MLEVEDLLEYYAEKYVYPTKVIELIANWAIGDYDEIGYMMSYNLFINVLLSKHSEYDENELNELYNIYCSMYDKIEEDNYYND